MKIHFIIFKTAAYFCQMLDIKTQKTFHVSSVIITFFYVYLSQVCRFLESTDSAVRHAKINTQNKKKNRMNANIIKIEIDSKFTGLQIYSQSATFHNDLEDRL